MTETLVLLPSILASLASTIGLISYGLLVEKHFVAYYSAVWNTFGSFLSLASVAVPWNLYLFYIPYFVIVALIVVKEWKDAFFLVSTKVFGSLMPRNEFARSRSNYCSVQSKGDHPKEIISIPNPTLRLD